MSADRPTRSRPRARDRPRRDVERAPSLAGRRALVRRDDRASLVVSLAMGGIDAVGRQREPERAPARGRARRTTSSTRAARTIRSSSSSSSSAGRPGATTDPAFQDGGRRARGRAPGRQARRSTASTRRPSTSSPTRSRRRPRPGSSRADGSTVRIVGRIPGDATRVAPLLAPVRPILDAARAANPTLDDPRHQQHVHQRRHQRADQRRARRVAPADDPADVPDPAVRVRGDRRVGRAARAGDHVAASRRSGSSASTARSSGRSARTRPS